MRVPARLLTIVLAGGVGLGGGAAALSVPISALVHHAAGGVANPTIDINAPQSQRSVVYAADGSVLAYLHVENRSPVSLDKVPADLVNAVVDTEDARFWSHGGFDVKSSLRALLSDAGGRSLQGGSTITQQLVKTLTNTPQRNLNRKVKEAVIASRLEKKYGRRAILQAYLNAIYFGNNAYGVQAAAETYWNTDVSRLTTTQAAFLAGMIQDPQGYDPINNPRTSLERRNIVLDRMIAQHHLDAARGEQLKAEPIPVVISPLAGTANTSNDYFVEEVKKILLNRSTTLGNSYTERYNALFRGGYNIYTNLDPHLQTLAEQAVNHDLPKQDQFRAALVSIEPSTGKVRALVGGPGYDKIKYDLATQGYRQPGSGFKLFTLLSHYENGGSPFDVVDGSSPCAVDFPTDHELLTKPIKNNEGEAFGPINVMTATANSVNCAYIRIAQQVGLPKIVDMASRLGLSQKFDLFPSTIIGGDKGATVLEMTNAYATLADDGVYHRPSFIDHITDRTGKTVFKSNEPPKRVLDQQVSRLAVQTLKAVVQYGTGTAAGLPNQEVAGKTGTTESDTDAWFNGITPQLATSVWMGDPAGITPMNPNHGLPIVVYGGTYPARIWHDYMAPALDGQTAQYFPSPDPSQIPYGKFISGNGSNPYPYPFTSTPSSGTTLPFQTPFTFPGFPPTTFPHHRPPSTTSSTDFPTSSTTSTTVKHGGNSTTTTTNTTFPN